MILCAGMSNPVANRTESQTTVNLKLNVSIILWWSWPLRLFYDLFGPFPLGVYCSRQRCQEKKNTEACSNPAAALRVFRHFLRQQSQTAFVYWHCTDGIHFLKNDQANMSVSFSESALFVRSVSLDCHVLLKTDPKSEKPFTSLFCTIWNTRLLFRPSPAQEEQLVWFNPSLHDLRWRNRMHNVALYFIPSPAIVHHEWTIIHQIPL